LLQGCRNRDAPSFYPFSSSSFLFLESPLGTLPIAGSVLANWTVPAFPTISNHRLDREILIFNYTMTVTKRELPLSPPKSSGGDLTPERSSGLNSLCLPGFLPNGMEHHEIGADPLSMVISLYLTNCISCSNKWIGIHFSSLILLPAYWLLNFHAYLNFCKYCNSPGPSCGKLIGETQDAYAQHCCPHTSSWGG